MITDSEIVKELVEELVSVQRVAPFKFGIYYDAKNEPARVTVHRVIRNGTMGIVEFERIASARFWCDDALREGYEVERLTPRGECLGSSSVSRRRRYYEQKAKYDAMTPEQREIEDEIPF